jgi:hypothetical protein
MNNSVIKAKNDCHADDKKVLGFQASFIFQFANDYKHKLPRCVLPPRTCFILTTFLICPDQLQMKTNSVIKTKNDCHSDDKKVFGFQASFIFQFANDCECHKRGSDPL